MSEGKRVASLDEIPEEGSLRVELDGTPICIARSQGEVFAIHDVCSHADVALSEGDVEDGTIECWLHGSRFDLRTGRPTGLPATKPVATYPVTVEGDDVLVKLES
ncbi:MAG: 3-phenylpropionate/trans-cinnamate dioxygenase ferredoxin component [Actinomycetota bacterium]|nr:3-phenylpropionate/trans-cinnamate dioxygenase ferredoxin component [Actinomycetota bacterium]